MKICVLPGDGIGPEIMAQAIRVLNALGLKLEMEEALLGGCAVDATGTPYPEATQKLAREADALLLGAVGGPKWDSLPREQRAPTDRGAAIPPRGIFGICPYLGFRNTCRSCLANTIARSPRGPYLSILTPPLSFGNSSRRQSSSGRWLRATRCDKKARSSRRST